MTHTLYVLLSVTVGLGAATQLAMLGAMGRDRGAYEATWISIVGTVAGLAIVLVFRSLRGASPNLPAPLDAGWPFAIVLAICGVVLLVSMRGLAPYLALCGLFATAYLLTVGFAVPHIGAALFLGAATAGTLRSSSSTCGMVASACPGDMASGASTTWIEQCPPSFLLSMAAVVHPAAPPPTTAMRLIRRSGSIDC